MLVIIDYNFPIIGYAPGNVTVYVRVINENELPFGYECVCVCVCVRVEVWFIGPCSPLYFVSSWFPCLLMSINEFIRNAFYFASFSGINRFISFLFGTAATKPFLTTSICSEAC